MFVCQLGPESCNVPPVANPKEYSDIKVPKLDAFPFELLGSHPSLVYIF